MRQVLQGIVNEHEGEFASTWSVPVEKIQESIRNGMRKVNIDTDLMLLLISELGKQLLTGEAKSSILANA